MLKRNVFITSDTHFGHRNICVFLKADGSKLRPWDDVEKMNEEMILRWNNTVGPNDRVFHLGDFVINRKYLPIANRLNGEKILIMGNHDNFKTEELTPYFKELHAYREWSGLIFSHIPVHESNKYRWQGNVHGHLHDKVLPDPWYMNVSAERTNFTPIPIETVLENFKLK